MRALRLTVPIILFAAFLVGCIVQADTFSDQNPFSAPDTLQSGGDGGVEGTKSNSTTEEKPTATPLLPTATPILPTATPIPPTATLEPTPTPTCESWHTSEECDRLQGRTGTQKLRQRDDYEAAASVTPESASR